LPEAAVWRQPAADAYASGTPTPFISISHVRSNACLIQSEKVLNVMDQTRSFIANVGDRFEHVIEKVDTELVGLAIEQPLDCAAN